MGRLDAGFNPEVGGDYNDFDDVISLAVQADGKILAGGNFDSLGGQTRNHIARLNADGTVDSQFNPGADTSVSSLAVQADGKIIVGGGFVMLAGQSRPYIARLNNTEPATQRSDVGWLDRHLAAGRHQPRGLAHHLRRFHQRYSLAEPGRGHPHQRWLAANGSFVADERDPPGAGLCHRRLSERQRVVCGKRRWPSGHPEPVGQPDK